MSDDIQVRGANTEDVVQVVKLLKLVFNDWPHIHIGGSSEDYWRWKYTRYPNRPLEIVLAESDGEVIGVNHSYPVTIKIGDKILSCNHATDLGIHPDFRRLGIYPRLSEFKTALHKSTGCKLNYGITNIPRVIESSKVAGRPPFPHQVKAMMRVHDIDLHIEKKKIENPLIVKTGVRTLQTLDNIRRRIRDSTPDLDLNIKIEKIDTFNDSFTYFWDEISEHYDFIVERSPAYLNWRYCDTRGGSFDKYVAFLDEQILGYVVSSVNRYQPDYPEGYIVDILYLPDRSDVARVLLNRVIEDMDKDNINVVHGFAVEDNVIESIFRQFGFLDTRRNPYIMLNPFCVGAEWDKFLSSHPSRVHFEYGDTDWV